jgi:type IV secretion system protein VirD4
MPGVPAATITLPESAADDGGLRRQPELADEVIYVPASDRATDDLAMLDDDDLPLPIPAQLDPRLQRTARLATLDPADGIPL